MTKKMKDDHMNELINFGETYLGSMEIMGVAYVDKKYKALSKEVTKKLGKTLVMSSESGMAWMI